MGAADVIISDKGTYQKWGILGAVAGILSDSSIGYNIRTGIATNPWSKDKAHGGPAS